MIVHGTRERPKLAETVTLSISVERHGPTETDRRDCSHAVVAHAHIVDQNLPTLISTYGRRGRGENKTDGGVESLASSLFGHYASLTRVPSPERVYHSPEDKCRSGQHHILALRQRSPHAGRTRPGKCPQPDSDPANGRGVFGSRKTSEGQT